MDQPIIRTLMWILNAYTEADFPVRYWSACALCHLIDFYNSGNWLIVEPSHTQVNDAVTKAIAGWIYLLSKIIMEWGFKTFIYN